MSPVQQNGTVVVVGQGYVGLPLAIRVNEVYPRVFGLDRSAGLVAELKRGESPGAIVSTPKLRDALRNGYEPTSDASVIQRADVVVICVPTPLGIGRSPDLSALKSVASTLTNTKAGVLVVLESTSFPGTTEEILLPELTKDGRIIDRDFHLAFSPERIDPANPTFNLVNTPRLVGGVTPESGARAAAFYAHVVDNVRVLKSSKEAELAKLIENTYRHVNIALANELLIIANGLGIDFWDAQRGAATKPYGFQAFWPSPGVGGHCIPIDPQYLAAVSENVLGYSPKFISLATKVNSAMIAYTVHRIGQMMFSRGEALLGANVLVLGVTYKPNVADTRESSARPLIRELQAAGALVRFHDPFVSLLDLTSDDSLQSVEDPGQAAHEAEVVLILQAHKSYDWSMLADFEGLIVDAGGQASCPGALTL